MKPKAVLIYQTDEVLVEGLIFEEGIKSIEYQSEELKNFEYDYCKECSFYKTGDEEYPPNVYEMQCTLLSELKTSIYSKHQDEVDELIYDYCLDTIEDIICIEDVERIMGIWGVRSEPIFSFCYPYLIEYASEYNYWSEEKDNRYCEGGWTVLEERECEVHDIDDFKQTSIYEVGLPSHMWIKLSDIEYPEAYDYLLLGLINYKGYVMPPLAIGNVWSSLNTFKNEVSIGMVCWGDVRQSSNIRTAYNQFWGGSIFNYDNVGSNINLDKSKEYGKLLLQGIKERVDKDYGLNENYVNNIILEDGKFKEGVTIHKL